MELIDRELLSAHIKAKRNMPLRQTAKEIGISAATLQRIERGKLPDIYTAIKICSWLQMPLDSFTYTE